MSVRAVTLILLVEPDERAQLLYRDGFRALGPGFEVHATTRGSDAVRELTQARSSGRPFGVAVIGVSSSGAELELVSQLWQTQPELEVVLCGKGGWTDLLPQLGAPGTDRLVVMTRPFEAIELRQLVAFLAEKWQRGRALDDRLRDIDAAVHAEVQVRLRERAHDELSSRRSHRLEALGRLAAGLAHEINTPAQYVSSSLEFLAESLPLIQEAVAASPRAADPAVVEIMTELPRSLGDAREGIERIARIVKTVRSHSHLRDREGVAPLDVNPQVEAALELARSEYKHVADAVVRLGDVPRVLGDPGDLMLAIMNLVLNAAHAIRDHQAASEGAGRRRGTITVSTRALEHHVEITVADTGGGIPEDIRDRVFEPFFTTKPIGQGTGQGLSIARATIVERHHGQLSFESELGRGTVFTILLPRLATEDAG